MSETAIHSEGHRSVALFHDTPTSWLAHSHSMFKVWKRVLKISCGPNRKLFEGVRLIFARIWRTAQRSPSSKINSIENSHSQLRCNDDFNMLIT